MNTSDTIEVTETELLALGVDPEAIAVLKRSARRVAFIGDRASGRIADIIHRDDALTAMLYEPTAPDVCAIDMSRVIEPIDTSAMDKLVASLLPPSPERPLNRKQRRAARFRRGDRW